MPAKPKSALASVESLLLAMKETAEDAEQEAREGGLGETTVQLNGLMQAVVDVLADVRARIASEKRRKDVK